MTALQNHQRPTPSPQPLGSDDAGVGEDTAQSSREAGTPSDDRLQHLIIEWFQTYLGHIVWSTLWQVVVAPARLSVDWWEHRREEQMSPVRSLMSVVLLGTVASLLQRLVFPQGEARLGTLIEVFVWQTAVVLAVATVVVLSITLPRRLDRSNYQHAVFALYECTFVCLVVWVFALLVILTGFWAVGFAGVGAAMAPLVLPGAAIAIAAHAVWHLRAAYRLSWIGAAFRVVAVAVIALPTSLIMSFVLMVSGVSELWMPQGPEVMPTFHRE